METKLYLVGGSQFASSFLTGRSEEDLKKVQLSFLAGLQKLMEEHAVIKLDVAIDPIEYAQYRTELAKETKDTESKPQVETPIEEAIMLDPIETTPATT